MIDDLVHSIGVFDLTTQDIGLLRCRPRFPGSVVPWSTEKGNRLRKEAFLRVIRSRLSLLFLFLFLSPIPPFSHSHLYNSRLFHSTVHIAERFGGGHPLSSRALL